MSNLDPIHAEVTSHTAGGNHTPERTAAYTAKLHDISPEGVPNIPGYAIERELGRGGMGVVYFARDLSLNRTVALKMILNGAHAGSNQLRRFLSEAETVARLQHPHIIQIYDTGESGGLPYFALEYAGGGTLAELLHEQPLSPREAAQLLWQLADGIGYAHEQNIIHRDLKPENILLAAGDELIPRITDFGLAKCVDSTDGLTSTGAVMGTASYMAPEQARGDLKKVGPAADIYSLGAILYRSVTGRPPLQAASVAETLMLVLSAEPVAPRVLQPSVPRDLETIIMKCLQKDPGKRYASARALGEDLQNFLDGKVIRARPVGSLERLSKWTRRNPYIALLGSGVALLLVTITIGSVIATAMMDRRRAEAVKARKEADDARVALQEQYQALDVQKNRTEAERIRAEENLAKVEQVVDQFCTQVSEQKLLNVPGMEPLRRELLADAVSYYRDMVSRRSESSLASRMNTLNAYHRLAAIQILMGEKTEALTNLQTVRELSAALLKEFPDDLELKTDLAQASSKLGGPLRVAGYLEESLEMYQLAIRLRKKILEVTPDLPVIRWKLAFSQVGAGKTLMSTERIQEAVELLESGVRLHEAVLKSNPEYQTRILDLANVQNELGLAYRRLNRIDEAIDLHQKTVEAVEKVYRSSSSPACNAGTLASVLDILAGDYEVANRKTEAAEIYQKARDIRRQGNRGLVNNGGKFPEGVTGVADFDQLLASEGNVLTVQGRVVKTSQVPGGGMFFINFADQIKSAFVAIVLKPDIQQFQNAFNGNAANALKGRTVRIRGVIKVYQGIPEIFISDPSQIVIVVNGDEMPTAQKMPTPKQIMKPPVASLVLLPGESAPDDPKLKDRIGETVTIRTQIRNATVNTSGSITYINFEGIPRGGLCAVVRRPDLQAVSWAFDGDLNKALTGKVILLKGKLQEYQGRQEIVVSDPNQIEIVKEK